MVLVTTVLAAVQAAAYYLETPAAGIDPAQAVRYSRLYRDARSLFEQNKGAEAMPLLKEARSIYDQDGDLHYRLAGQLLAAKDYRGAIEAYGKALELGAFAPKLRASCFYDMACAYALQGDVKQGFAYLEKAMAAGFRDLAHLRTDGDLQALHSDPRWEEIAATRDVSKMSREQGWRYDLWLLDREMRRVHFNPYRMHTPAELDLFVRNLSARIPSLTDAQVMAEFMKYAVLLGDGHTHVRPASDSPFMRTLPIQMFWFEDGMFVTAASPDQAELAGAAVLKVGGKSIEELRKIFDPIISRDNPQGVRAALAFRLAAPALGHALGVNRSADEATLTIRDVKGQTRDVTLRAGVNPVGTEWATARKSSANPDPLYLKNRSKPYSFEAVPELRAVYFQYNAVRSDPTDPLPAFCQRMFEFIDKNGVDNLIVDVRWNGGGNSFLNRNIQDGILARPKLNQQGHFFLITGRNTFSAAQNFTTDLVRNANPILVGEPTGSSPNFIGETIRLELPYSKAQCSISDLYWQRSWPMDHRAWLAPQLPAPPVFALYKENRDPAMEAIRAFLAADKR
jgi:hypothetical protein